MGFPEDRAKKALAASKSTTLNDLIDLIIKDMSENPVEPSPEQIPDKKEYVPYNCEVCTLFNEINPGPHC